MELNSTNNCPTGIINPCRASEKIVSRGLTKDFTKLVGLATLVSWPLAYYAMNSWLQDFAYRIQINSQFLTFLIAAALALVIALITVSVQAVKAALSNPVNSLRYE
jgi:putative ABC transport system permease protein